MLAFLANVVCLHTVVAHLVWQVEEGGLQHHHEGDPLVEGGLWSLLKALIFTIF